MTAITDETATAILGPACPSCGWRRGNHRPAAPGMGVEGCPEGEG
jgi:hypothetical protein